MIREALSDADLEAWVEIKNAVVPNEPTTVEAVRRAETAARTLLLADGKGCAIVDESSFGNKAFIAVRVLPEHRGRGVGRALAERAFDCARALGRDGVNSFVYADEPHSIAFAESYGLANVDYQLQQVRTIGDEPPPPVELTSLADDREALIARVWDEVAKDAYLDLPLPGDVTYSRDEFLREEATRPDGSFVAFDDGVIVGYAGLMEHANGPARAEHGLTAVRRDHRRRGIARALKLAQLHWASQNGVVELITWTQKGNEAMQSLNRSLGYRDVSKVITYQGPLP